MVAGDVLVAITKNSSKGCTRFDGIDDVVTINNDPSLLDYSEITLSAWIYVNTLPSPTFPGIINLDAVGDRGFQISLVHTSNKVNFVVSYDGTNTFSATTTSGIDLRKWVHVAVTWSNNTVKHYINGSLDRTATITGGAKIYASSQDLFIGKRITETLDGYISDTGIYNKVLTATEITSLYKKRPIKRGLVSCWKLTNDYQDCVGSNHGTNTGTHFAIIDENISTKIATNRTTANDQYMVMGCAGGEVISVVIEEA